MPERMLRFLGAIEIINALAAVSMTVALLIALYFLDRNYHELTALKQQMTIRNAQGGEALRLLGQAVERLEKLEKLERDGVE